jgi:TPR repeat protein
LSYWDTDYDKAVQGLQIAADHGIARAKTYLGYAYAKGLGGVPQDDNTAIRLWREAAAQNEPRAEEALGWAYEKGRGVPVNPSEARAWYQRAASHGNQAAESKLGSPETKSAGNYEVVAAILLGLLVIGIATAGSTQGVPAEDAPSGGGFMDMTDPTACGNYHDDGHQVMVV